MKSRPKIRRLLTFKYAALLLGLLFLFHLALLTVLVKDEAVLAVISTLAAPVESLLAVIGLCWAAVSSLRYSRSLFLAWALIAAAQISWLIGDLVWAVLEVGLGLSPFPSVADVFYLLYYPLFIAGALSIPMVRFTRSQWLKLMLDMGIVVLATLLIFWYFWIGPLMETEATDFMTMVLSLTYPIADFILMVALFIVLFRRFETQVQGPILLLAAGVGLQIVTDAVFGYQSTAGTYEGGLLDMGWVAAVYLAGLAGVLQADALRGAAVSRRTGVFRTESKAASSWIIYVPYFWLAAAYLLLGYSYGRDIPMKFTTLMIWVGLIIVLVVVRQIVSLGENVALLEEQKRVDRALVQSEVKYRVVVEHAIEGIAVAQDGVFKYLNPAALAMVGYRSDEILERPFLDIVYPDDAPALVAEYERKLSGDERTFVSRYRVVTRDGSIRWMEGTGVLIEWQERSAILSYVRDITDRKEADEAQEVQNRRVIRYQSTLLDLARADLSDLASSFAVIAEVTAQTLPVSRVGVWLLSDDGRRLICRELYRNEEKTHEGGHSFESKQCPRYFKALEESRILSIEDVLTDPRTSEFRKSYLVPNGIAAMLNVPIRVQGSMSGVFCLEQTGHPRQWLLEEQEFAASVADIVSLALEAFERKRAETALQESEERYRTLFENSLDTLFTVDLKGNFTSLNKAGETLTGYPRSELIGKNYRDYVRPEVVERIYRAYNALYRTGVPISGLRYAIMRNDGQERTVEGYVTLQKKGKAVIGFQGTIKDITEQLRLEHQLIQSQKMEAVGTMAGGIAHNFNNIMVGIMGYSEFLAMSKQPDDPDYKALKIIHEGTVRASELTRQLLNISRGGQFNLVIIKLNQAVERILPLISGTFDKSIEVSTHLAPDLMAMEGDLSQIEQCLLNLCINARDAMPQGGRLIIETNNQVLDDDFVRSHLGASPGPHVVITISDTGTGISPDIRDHIFEPFFTTKHGRGTGMGLATVYGIVRSHNGIISVYTEAGKGTSFKLYFPVTSAVKEEPAEDRHTKESIRDAMILIIDDEPVVREMWEDFLVQKGYRVIVAEDGHEGIERFRELKDEIDLVILDLIMPRLGGKETLAALKEIDPAVKVLVTSGYSENGQAGEIVDLGIDGFLQKPSQLAQLERQIIDILRK